MKKGNGLTYLLLTVASIFIMLACTKDNKTEEIKKGVPVLTTNSVSNIKTTSATSGGNITSDGGMSVTSRGVCWNTTQNPTNTDKKTLDGSGIGTYSSSVTGLKASTTYYVRAYATNSTGTGYGEMQTFKTSDPLPGAVTFTLSWDIKWTSNCGSYWPCWDVLIGVGYNQSDVDKEAFFNHKELSAPGTYSVTNLPPGTYYYRAKKTIRESCYIALCPKPDPVIKSGSFQVSSNVTTTKTVSL